MSEERDQRLEALLDAKQPWLNWPLLTEEQREDIRSLLADCREWKRKAGEEQRAKWGAEQDREHWRERAGRAEAENEALRAEREAWVRRIAELEGEARVLIGCPCWCHTGDGPEPHGDCRECVRGTATPTAIDCDHTEAQWREKWTAALDLMGSQAKRAEKAEAENEALRENNQTEPLRVEVAALRAELDHLKANNRYQAGYAAGEKSMRAEYAALCAEGDRKMLEAERDRLREALVLASEWLALLIEQHRERCGNPDWECPLQDCEKPDDLAGVLAKARAALASGEESREPASAGPAEEPRRLPRERCSRCEPDGDRCFPCAHGVHGPKPAEGQA